MGHHDVRTSFVENCGSTSIRDQTVTRATVERKLGPYKRNLYEDFNALKVKVNANTRQGIVHKWILKRMNVGSFCISTFCCNLLPKNKHTHISTTICIAL